MVYLEAEEARVVQVLALKSFSCLRTQHLLFTIIKIVGDICKSIGTKIGTLQEHIQGVLSTKTAFLLKLKDTPCSAVKRTYLFEEDHLTQALHRLKLK